MSVPMVVMMRTIMIDNGSSAKARLSWNPSCVSSMFQRTWRSIRSAGAAPMSWAAQTSPTSQLRTMAPMAMEWFAALPIERWIRTPASALTVKPTSGKSGMRKRSELACGMSRMISWAPCADS